MVLRQDIRDYEIVIQDCHFEKVKHMNIYFKDKVLFDFIVTIHNDKKFRFALHNISDLYVLVGNKFSNNIVSGDEKKFSEILPPKENEYLETHEQIVLGYMMTSKSQIRDDTDYLEFIDTTVPKLNLANFMIESYEKRFSRGNLIPREFIDVSIDYWLKKSFFHHFVCEDYMEQLDEFFNIEELKDEIRWDVLYKRIEELVLINNAVLISNWYKKYKRIQTLWKIAEYYTSNKYSPENALKYINLED